MPRKCKTRKKLIVLLDHGHWSGWNQPYNIGGPSPYLDTSSGATDGKHQGCWGALGKIVGKKTHAYYLLI